MMRLTMELKMVWTKELAAIRDTAEAEEDKSAFRHGVQIANEAMFRALLLAVLNPLDSKSARHEEAARIRKMVELTIALSLQNDGVPDGIEAKSAEGIVASVFDDLLAADALPPETAG